ncbi:hypothetical protein BDP81DRAFT_426885 [Colletotrichum phormii]|uniref:Uncharacterized protein n=1 Tax=Colletotrichum phormii TaxID=359342 RepID=A0AAI9ZV47_9PEZI|nr:uncharacterized protein BDP81DRAFT_426885 [Colletotrichum phormii]KAK1637187.1 hypothetical protein BDP81DRAFT_426885 [Colletotrichum phormii]
MAEGQPYRLWDRNTSEVKKRRRLLHGRKVGNNGKLEEPAMKTSESQRETFNHPCKERLIRRGSTVERQAARTDLQRMNGPVECLVTTSSRHPEDVCILYSALRTLLRSPIPAGAISGARVRTAEPCPRSPGPGTGVGHPTITPLHRTRRAPTHGRLLEMFHERERGLPGDPDAVQGGILLRWYPLES